MFDGAGQVVLRFLAVLREDIEGTPLQAPELDLGNATCMVEKYPTWLYQMSTAPVKPTDVMRTRYSHWTNETMKGVCTIDTTSGSGAITSSVMNVIETRILN